MSKHALIGAKDKETHVWREWQPSWCLRRARRGKPRQLLEALEQPTIGSEGLSEEKRENRSQRKSLQARQTGTNLEILRNLTDEPLERQLSDKQLCRLLVTTYFAEGDGTRPELMGFIDTAI